MSRILIEDLSPTLDLTAEELEELFGAGRSYFRPSLESLEGREMYSVNLGSVASLPNVATDAAFTRTLTAGNEFKAESMQAAASASAPVLASVVPVAPVASNTSTPLASETVGGALAASDPGVTETTDADGFKHKVREFQDGDHTSHEVQIFNKAGARVFFGIEEKNPNGNGYRFKAESTSPGQPPVTSVYDSYDGQWQNGRWVAAPNQTLLSRDSAVGGVKVHGEVNNDGKWVETRPNRTDVFDKADGALRQTTTTYPDHTVTGKPRESDGKWIETTTHSKLFEERIEVYSKHGGKLETRETTYPDRTVEGKYTEAGLWREETSFDAKSKVRSQVDTYDKVDGTLTSREIIGRENQPSMTGTLLKDGTWQEYTKDSKEFRFRTELYSKSGADRVLLHSDTTFADRQVRGQQRQDGKWVESTTAIGGSLAFTKKTEVYDKPGAGRTLLSSDSYGKDGALTHGELTQGKWVETKFVGGIHIQPDGSISLTSSDGTVRVYQRVGDSWKIVSSNHKAAEGWVEEIWSADGTYTKNVWSSNQHGQAGSKGHLSNTVIAGGKMIVTMYHMQGYNYWYNGLCYPAGDATVRWVYSTDANGKPNLADRLEYEINNNDGYSNHWKKNGGSAYYSNGWKEWVYGDAPDVPSTVIAAISVQAQTVPSVPGVTVQAAAKGNTWVETIWNEAHTESVVFVYRGQDNKELLSQTHGRFVKETLPPNVMVPKDYQGEWVETTTHSKDFKTQTEVFDSQGGRMIRSEVTRTVANGGEATFKGQWQGEKWVETSTNYLGFKAVTVEFQQPHGNAVKRFGQLADGRYAVDTFENGHVQKREVFDKQGGAILETYSPTDQGFQISRKITYRDSSTQPRIIDDVASYKRDAYGRFELNSYIAHYDKPVEYTFKDKEHTSTTYHWRTFEDKKEGTQYREGYGSLTGNEDEGGVSPAPPSYQTLATEDVYWNRI